MKNRQKEHDKKNDSENYFVEASHWYAEKYTSRTTLLSWSMGLNVGLFLLLMLSIGTIWFMMPLKKVEDRVFTIQSNTGEFTEIKKLEMGHFTPTWQLNRFFILKYLNERESYDARYLIEPYRRIVAMSDQRVGHEYMNLWSDQNKESPLNLYGKNKYIKTKIDWVTPIGNDTAEARMSVFLYGTDDTLIQRKDFNLVIKWKYNNISQSQRMRDYNPIGFTVTYYQKSEID